MPVPCPHCKADLGTGYLTEDTLKERLREKDAKIGELQPLADAGRRVPELEALLGKANGSLTKVKALAAAGITTDGKIKHFSRAYDDYVAEAGKNALGFNEWLAGPARQDELLALAFVSAGQGGGGGGGKGDTKDAGAGAGGKADGAKGDAGGDVSKGQGGGGNGLPDLNKGAGQGGAGGGRRTADENQRYFRSAEFNALTVEQKRAKIAELQRAAEEGGAAAT